MEKIVQFLRTAFPYLLAIALWRLAIPFWNPAGVLAIIPVFYCTFVKKAPMFGLFGVLICFLIDYKFDTTLFWTTMFLIMYAVNGFQNFIDLTRADKNALDVFMIFFGASIMILFFTGISFTNLFRAIWMFSWTTILYIPITKLIGAIKND